MATVWHLRDKLQPSPVVVTETHRDTGRGDYVTYRFLCNVTENGRFEPFFSSIFFISRVRYFGNWNIYWCISMIS